MPKHLFIEGPSGIGKTTLLLNELGSLRHRVGGFVSFCPKLVEARGLSQSFYYSD